MKKIIGITFGFILLTIVTQIGGVVLVGSVLLCQWLNVKNRWLKIIIYCIIYLFFTFAITPNVAPYFGRKALPLSSGYIHAHNPGTILLNRNYVSKEMYNTLKKIALDYHQKTDGSVYYLDANFPFADGFPLLPHLSHNDGKKIDLSLAYKNQNEIIPNPSITGYGIYVQGQSPSCSSALFYQFPKWLGIHKPEYNGTFNANATRILIKSILDQANVQKLFIEPYLKEQLQLHHPKIRFHGCHSVRHDDHIHFQIL